MSKVEPFDFRIPKDRVMTFDETLVAKLNELIEAHNTHVESCEEKHTPDKSVFSEDYYSLARDN